MTENEEFEFRLRLEKERAAPSVRQELSNPVTGMRAALGATANLATSTAAAPIAGIAGLFGTALPGPQGQGAEIARKTQEALTYQPKTPGGRAIAETAAAPFTYLAGKAEQAGGKVTDIFGSPALGTAASTGIQALPAVIGKVAQVPLRSALAKSRAEAIGRASRNSVKDATYKAALDEGYGVPKSEYAPTFLGNRLESIGGKAAIRQEFEIRNQQVTNRIARREAGLADDAPLSEATLEAARERISQPYRDVAGVSPRAAAALENLKQVRHDSKAYWRHYGVSADPASLRTAKAMDTKAAMLEKLIDAEATKAGRPDLVTQLRDARVQLAKNYAVDKALNVGDGNVNALVIGKMRDKGQPLSGGLKTMGDFAEAFPRFARAESKVPAAGVSKTEAIVSAMSGAAGANMFGPPGIAAAAVPLIAPAIARAWVLSRQGPRTYPPSTFLQNAADAASAAPWIGLGGMTQGQ
jgi:hypothetical protein